MKKGINVKDLKPAYVIHPGEILLEDLEIRKIEPSDFAIRIGMTHDQLVELFEGKINITKKLASVIARELKMDMILWLNLHRNYITNLNKLKM